MLDAEAENIDGTSQKFEITSDSSNVAWEEVSTNSQFEIIENSSGAETTEPVVIKVAAASNEGLETIEGAIEVHKKAAPEDKVVVSISQTMHPKNDETELYEDPSKTIDELGLTQGEEHPTKENWTFWNAHEFTNGTVGFWNFNTRLGIEHAIFNADMRVISDGTLKLKTRKLETPTTNMYGDPAEYETAPLYSKRHHQAGVKWVKFTENMRIEVRYRSSGHTGFNEAIWLMGQTNYDGSGVPWPDNGEIDIMESPFMNKPYFTIHTENYSSVSGNAESSSIPIYDETQFNIYWVEILEDRIIGGVNGYQYFEHVKGDGGNNDWPWDDPAGMMLILTPGIGGWTGEMPNMQAGEVAVMEFDWIRVYVNDKFDESSQAGHDGTFY